MKKQSFILIGIVSVFVLGGYLTPKLFLNRVQKAHVTKAKMINYSYYVSATGEISQKNKKYIKSEYPVIISEVLVKKGQTVKKGQMVAKVDKRLTAEALTKSAPYPEVAGVSLTDMTASYSKMLKTIPEKVVSNIDGVVEGVNIGDGEYVDKDGIIATMSSAGDLYVSANVNQNKISEIKLDQLVEISGPWQGDNVYFGHIKSINSSATKEYVGTNKQTVVGIEISIENADKTIKPGYSANAKIITKPSRELLLAPFEAIGQDNDGNQFVYVFKDGYAKKKVIETGVELYDGAEIVSGISKDDIILYPCDNIKKDNALVRIVDKE